MVPMPTSAVSKQASGLTAMGLAVADGAPTLDGGKKLVQVGVEDDTKQGLAAENQTNRNRAESKAVNEVCGAVDGVDHPGGDR